MVNNLLTASYIKMRLSPVVIRFVYVPRSVQCLRWYSKQQTAHGSTTKPDPLTAQHDYIGPADKVSNLRPIMRHIPPNETPLGKRLREKRFEVESWNLEFWSRHNKRYYEEKDMFVKAHHDKGIEDISADKMSEFYKKFLDKNRKLHFYYNVSWYAKNLDLLVLSAQHGIQTAWRKLRKTSPT